MARSCGGKAGRGTARCLVAVALVAASGCADVGPVGVVPEAPSSVPDADVGRRIPAVAGAPLPPGAVAGTARVVRRHGLRLMGARVRSGEIVRRDKVLGSLGRPDHRIPVSASAVPPSSPGHLPEGMPSPGFPTGTARDGDDEGCWYLVYYWMDNGEIFHVMLLSCGGGNGSENEPECTEDQKAIAAEYDDDAEWPCDKFDDAPASGGGGSHDHETGFLADSYTSGRSSVLAHVRANGVAGAQVNSDWRCPEGNRQEHGRPGSRHVRGLAGDFDATDFDAVVHGKFAAAAVAANARWYSKYGTGLDARGNKMYTSHIHIDWW